MAVATTAWIAPSVLTLDRVSAAVGSCTAETPSASNGASLIAPPSTMVEGTAGLESNTTTYVWLEQEAVILDNALTVNRTVAGSFNGASDEGATIAAGTEIASYYVHGDLLAGNGNLTGQITFANATILGLIYRMTDISGSTFLQAPATTYVAEAFEGSETLVLSLASGANSVSWNMNFGNKQLDGMRVIVSCG
jgi:hypothetical protein